MKPALAILLALLTASCSPPWDGDLWWSCEKKAEIMYVDTQCVVPGVSQDGYAERCQGAREIMEAHCMDCTAEYVEWVNCVPEQDCLTCNPAWAAFRACCVAAP